MAAPNPVPAQNPNPAPYYPVFLSLASDPLTWAEREQEIENKIKEQFPNYKLPVIKEKVFDNKGKEIILTITDSITGTVTQEPLIIKRYDTSRISPAELLSPQKLFEIRQEVYRESDRRVLLQAQTSSNLADLIGYPFDEANPNKQTIKGAIHEFDAKIDDKKDAVPMAERLEFLGKLGRPIEKFIEDANNRTLQRFTLYTFKTFSANAPRTNSLVGQFVAEVLSNVPKDKRGNSVDFAAAFLINLFSTAQRGGNQAKTAWQQHVFENPNIKGALYTELGVTSPPTSMEGLYKILINALADSNQQKKLYDFIRTQIQTGFHGEKLQKAAQALIAELETIGETRGLFLDVKLAYEYISDPIANQLTTANSAYTQLKQQVIASFPDDKPAIEKTEANIKRNLNARLLPKDNPYLGYCGSKVKAQPKRFGFTQAAVDAISNNNPAEQGEFFYKQILEKLPTHLPQDQDAFDVTYVNAICDPRKFASLLNAPKELQTQIKSILKIEPPTTPLTINLLFEKIWQYRKANQVVGLFKDAGLLKGEKYAEARNAFKDLTKIDLSGQHNRIRLAKKLHNDILEPPALALKKDEHAEIVKEYKDTKTQVAQKNFIIEAMGQNQRLREFYLQQMIDDVDNPPRSVTDPEQRKKWVKEANAHNKLMAQRQEQLSINQAELASLLSGKAEPISLGPLSMYSFFMNIFDAGIYTRQPQHVQFKDKEKNIWGKGFFLYENANGKNLRTYYANITLPDGKKTKKLLYAEPSALFLGTSFFTGFFRPSGEINLLEVYQSVEAAQQFLVANGGLIKLDKDGKPDLFAGKFSSMRPEHWKPLNIYDKVLENSNFWLYEAWVNIAGFALFSPLAAAVTLPYVIAWSIAAIFVSVGYMLGAVFSAGWKDPIKYSDNPFTLESAGNMLSKNPFTILWNMVTTSGAQTVKVKIAERVSYLFHEELRALYFSDSCGMTDKNRQELDSIKNGQGTAYKKAQGYYHKLQDNFKEEVNQLLKDKFGERDASGKPKVYTADQIAEARLEIIVQKTGMDSERQTYYKQQIIDMTQKAEEQKNQATHKHVAGQGFSNPR